MRKLSILGVSGSIGASAIGVVEAINRTDAGPLLEVVAVTGHRNIAGLAEAARRLGANFAVTADPGLLEPLRDALAGSGIGVSAGPEALIEAASMKADICLSAIVGAAGLAPTLAAVAAGADIALANKECLVAAGDLFMAEIVRAGVRLLPVDSEHNAVFQCLAGHEGEIERLILTASGGPFRTWTLGEMAKVTLAEASAHPNWDMGQRITIDSASMFNKALEMIEAHHLFGVAPDRIEVLVHPQSVIHSMVGLIDGSVLAHLGPADMSVAIGHALAWPERPNLPVERLDFARIGRLDFEEPDPERFPALRLARQVMAEGRGRGCVLNAAKETALSGFIEGRIKFLEIAGIAEDTLDHMFDWPAAADLGGVFATDAEARRIAGELVGARASC